MSKYLCLNMCVNLHDSINHVPYVYRIISNSIHIAIWMRHGYASPRALFPRFVSLYVIILRSNRYYSHNRLPFILLEVSVVYVVRKRPCHVIIVWTNNLHSDRMASQYYKCLLCTAFRSAWWSRATPRLALTYTMPPSFDACDSY